MAFTQKIFSSYQPYADGDYRIGELYRIWYDSKTHTLRIQLDPNTPGGTIIAGGGAVSGPAQGITFVGDDSTGTRISDNETLKITGTGGITTSMSGDILTINGNIPTTLNSLTDVLLTDPVNGQVLKYDSNIGQWVNAADLTTGGEGISLTDLTVSQQPATATGSLTYNNTTGVFSYSPSIGTITVVGDDSSGTIFNIGETIKVAGSTGISTAMVGDTLTITGTEGISNLYYGAFHNDNDTTLTADINSNTTQPLAVASTTGFPNTGSLIVGLEIISYTGKTATTFTGITLGVANSNPSTHSAGDYIAAAQVTPAGVPKTVLIDITDLSSGVTLNASTSEVTIVNAGTYNCMFSVQGANAGNSPDNIIVWFVVDGTAIPSSASYSTISAIHAGQPGASIMAVNLFYTFTAGQKLSLKWTTGGGTSVITSYPRNIATGIPASPGIILTVNRIA